MTNRTIQIRLGIGALVAAALLILYGIPNWVSAPSNVPKFVLSPLFWPYVLAALTGLTGLALLVSGLRIPEGGAPLNPEIEDPAAGARRLAMMAALMVVSMLVMSTLGMVWTAIAIFLATAWVVRSRHPKAAVICGIVIPLVLYAFFAHVAGVAIPQGEFVRLP